MGAIMVLFWPAIFMSQLHRVSILYALIVSIRVDLNHQVSIKIGLQHKPHLLFADDDSISNIHVFQYMARDSNTYVPGVLYV